MYCSLVFVALLALCNAALDPLAKGKGLKYIGSASDYTQFSDAPYVSVLKSAEFGQITVKNSMKWGSIEPTQGHFTFSGGDNVVNFAQANGKILRCHTLVWHQDLPGWVTSTRWTVATLTAALQNHITQVVSHYKGKCYAWDVVNEALNDDGSYRSSIFYQVLGANYINIAFAAAAAADPGAKLYYNDYSIETGGTKSKACRTMISNLKKAGVKIDGVGLQSHFEVGSTPILATQIANIQAFKSYGVEVAITELDIRMVLPLNTPKLIQQSYDYQTTISACRQAGCVGVTLWDYTDKYSWVGSTFPGMGAESPWDSNLGLKLCYGGIVVALS